MSHIVISQSYQAVGNLKVCFGFDIVVFMELTGNLSSSGKQRYFERICTNKISLFSVLFLEHVRTSFSLDMLERVSK